MTNRLTWQDVVFAHRAIRKGLYTCEQEIFQVEADALNSRLAPTLPVSATRPIRYHGIVHNSVLAHSIREDIARKLSGYDDATWSKLREDRKRTYRRAADSLITQWHEFARLFDAKQ